MAGLGTLFFGLLGSEGDFVGATEPTILVTVALLAAAFAIAFLLPKHARKAAFSAAFSWSRPRSRLPHAAITSSTERKLCPRSVSS